MSLIRKILHILYSHIRLLVTCLLLTSTYAIVSPESVYPPANSWHELVYVQGWPSPYIIRVSDLRYDKESWGKNVALRDKNEALWFIFQGVQYFYVWSLCLDIAIALGLSLFVVFLWHVHCIANRKPWLINVREAIIATLTVALVLIAGLVAITILRYKHDEELSFLAELEKTGWHAGWTNDDLPWYLRPVKQLGIIREEDYEYRGVSWPGGWADQLSTPDELAEESQDINDILVKLASKRPPLWFVRDVSIADQRLDARGVQALCKLFPYCTQLYLSGYMEDCLPHIRDREVAYLTRHLRNLRRLGLYGAKLTDEGVQHLAKLHKLNELAFDDKWKTTTGASLNCLLALPYLYCLEIPAHWALSDEEKQTIMRHGPTVYFIP